MSIWDKPPVRETVSRPARNIFSGAERPRRRRFAFFRFFGSSRFFFGVIGLAVALVVWVLLGGVSSPSRPVPVYVPAPPVEAGRNLSASEAAFAAPFGQPLHMGEGGFPVIRHHVTGEVREVTPFEAEWDSPALVRSTGMTDIVEAPGPRGWGVRWRDFSDRQLLAAYPAYPRHSWRARQETELQDAVDRVVSALSLAFSWDLGYSHRGKGAAVRQVIADLEASHPVIGTPAGWAAVPGQWRCDPEWESALHQGITSGCPTEAYLLLLRESWVSLGLLARSVDSIGLILETMERSSLSELQLSALPTDLHALVLDAQADAERLVGAFVVLHARSVSEGLPIYVDVPELP